MKTRITELLGIEIPIIQAPMAGVSTPALAAAVANAGGLGSVALGALNSEKGAAAIRAVRETTNYPFNVNFFCHEPPLRDDAKESAWLEVLRPTFEEFGSAPPLKLNEIYKSFNDDDEMLAMVLSERPAIISFHFGLPSPDRILALKSAGILLMSCVTTVAEAQQAKNAGIDILIAQGAEAGGHHGRCDGDGEEGDPLTTMALVRLIDSKVSLPLVAAGGIADGRGIAAAFALGADAVQMGTAFVSCPESTASPAYRAILANETAFATTATPVFSGRKARGVVTEFARRFQHQGSKVAAYPLAYDANKQLSAAAAAAGNTEFTPMWAGQAAALSRVMPAAELVTTLMQEARAEMTRLGELARI